MPTCDQGVNGRQYVVVPRSLIFLFNSKNEVLLLRGSPTKRLWAGLFNGIGGHIEAGEDILSSANRELREETGITDVELYLCGHIMVDVTSDTGVAIFLFKGYCDRAKLNSSPEGNLAWIALSELEQTQLVEDLHVILPKISAHKMGDRMLIGSYSYDNQGSLEILLQS